MLNRSSIKTFFIILISIASLHASDEISKQIWGNIVLGSMASNKVHTELDFEPKVQVSGQEEWRNIDVTPLVEYFPNRWIDLTAEMVIGYTKQTNDVKSYEFSPRLGIRFHIFGNIRQYLPEYKYFDFSRFDLSSLFRYEYRSLWFNDKDSEQQSRLRVRLESKIAFNHVNLSSDDTYYLFADVEGYFNIGEDIEEVFSNKARGRIGPGYRYDDKHIFELLMIYDYAKNTIEDESRHDAIAINFRYKIFY